MTSEEQASDWVDMYLTLGDELALSLDEAKQSIAALIDAGKQEERERAKRIVGEVRADELYQIRDVRASRFACDEILRRLESK